MGDAWLMGMAILTEGDGGNRIGACVGAAVVTVGAARRARLENALKAVSNLLKRLRPGG